MPSFSLFLAHHPLTQHDSHLVVVDLSRNFGHHKAMMTGLSAARGERVFLIDSDLEEEPEWMITFAAQMQSDASDVVYGVQGARRGGLFEQVTGKLFYKLFRMLTGIVQPNNIVWNFVGPGADVNIFKSVTVAFGTFLAPFRNIIQDHAVVTGRYIGAANGLSLKLHSAATLTCP